jgi:hypothetical protein
MDFNAHLGVGTADVEGASFPFERFKLFMNPKFKSLHSEANDSNKDFLQVGCWTFGVAELPTVVGGGGLGRPLPNSKKGQHTLMKSSTVILRVKLVENNTQFQAITGNWKLSIGP